MTLIGATTENPYFEVNSALLSRTQIYELEPHDVETLRGVMRRGAAALDAECPPEVEELIATARRRRRAQRARRSSNCRSRRLDADGVELSRPTVRGS